MIWPKICVLILFMSLLTATHAFIQTLGGSVFSGVSDTIKSLNPFNPSNNMFSRGAENQDSGFLSNAFENIKGTNKEAGNPSQGIEGYFRNAIARLDSFKPLSLTLGTVKSLTPMNRLRMGEGPTMQVDPTQFVRTGETEPELLESPQHLPLNM